MDAERARLISGWLAATDIDSLELIGPNTHLRLGGDAAPAAVGAPSVGVFLHRHPLREDGAPLAAHGARVSRGQLLGLLRIGALLLPVPAPHDGRVAAVLAAHGATVGYGTPLVDLRPL